jgi:hypothetical protein
MPVLSKICTLIRIELSHIQALCRTSLKMSVLIKRFYLYILKLADYRHSEEAFIVSIIVPPVGDRNGSVPRLHNGHRIVRRCTD